MEEMAQSGGQMSRNSPYCHNVECYCDWKYPCTFRKESGGQMSTADRLEEEWRQEWRRWSRGQMRVPTKGEVYSQLMEHLRLAQEASAMLSHLARANSENRNADGWLAISENFRKIQAVVTDLATKGLH